MDTVVGPPVGFWATISKRIIVISTMERDVRIMFAAGAVVMPVAFVLILLHRHLGRPIHTIAGNVPIGVLLVLVVCELLVLFLLSAGLLRLKGRGRYVSLAIILVAFIVFFSLNDFPSQALALLIPIVMLWTFAEIGQRRDWGARLFTKRAATVAIVTMIILLIYLVTGGQALVVSIIGFQGLFAMLGLFMVATDIAEIISLGAESSISRLAGIFSPAWPALFLTILAIVANVAVSLVHSDWSPSAIAIYLGSGLGLVLWLAPVYWALVGYGKGLGVIAPHISYRGLLFVVGAYFVALQAGLIYRFLSNPQTYEPEKMFGDPQVFIVPVLLFLVFLISFLILGRRSSRMFVPLGFGACVGMVWFHYYASKGEAMVYIQDAIAMGSIVFLITSSLMKSARYQFKALCILVGELNICFAAYALIAWPFLSAGGESGSFTIWKALIVFAALAWDVLSSGEAITNKHSDTFPRISRVCFFLAYIVSVALLVVVSTASELVNPVTSKAVEGVFESEPLVAVGLTLFGPPFFFLIFALRVREIRATSKVPSPSPEPKSAGS